MTAHQPEDGREWLRNVLTQIKRGQVPGNTLYDDDARPVAFLAQNPNTSAVFYGERTGEVDGEEAEFTVMKLTPDHSQKRRAQHIMDGTFGQKEFDGCRVNIATVQLPVQQGMNHSELFNALGSFPRGPNGQLAHDSISGTNTGALLRIVQKWFDHQHSG